MPEFDFSKYIVIRNPTGRKIGVVIYCGSGVDIDALEQAVKEIGVDVSKCKHNLSLVVDSDGIAPIGLLEKALLKICEQHGKARSEVNLSEMV